MKEINERLVGCWQLASLFLSGRNLEASESINFLTINLAPQTETKTKTKIETKTRTRPSLDSLSPGQRDWRSWHDMNHRYNSEFTRNGAHGGEQIEPQVASQLSC